MIFKCKRTGNIVEFIAEHDVKAMMKHPEYEVVTESKTKVSKKKNEFFSPEED